MDRRQFLLALPCGALLPSSASAQAAGRNYRIAVISPGPIEAFRNLTLPELARLGFVVGRNLRRTTARFLSFRTSIRPRPVWS